MTDETPASDIERREPELVADVSERPRLGEQVSQFIRDFHEWWAEDFGREKSGAFIVATLVGTGFYFFPEFVPIHPEHSKAIGFVLLFFGTVPVWGVLYILAHMVVLTPIYYAGVFIVAMAKRLFPSRRSPDA